MSVSLGPVVNAVFEIQRWKIELGWKNLLHNDPFSKHRRGGIFRCMPDTRSGAECNNDSAVFMPLKEMMSRKNISHERYPRP